MKEKDEVCIHVPSQWEMLGLGDMSMYRKRKARGALFRFVVFPDGLFQWWMYLDQNKHTRFLSFSAYCVNIYGVFILPSKVHFIIIWVLTFFVTLYQAIFLPLWFSSEQPSTPICSTNPLTQVVGDWFSHFSTKWLNYSISSPKARF